jgi:hypothetical protein
LALAQEDSDVHLNLCQPQVRNADRDDGFERLGHWVPATSAGTTALGVAASKWEPLDPALPAFAPMPSGAEREAMAEQCRG